MIEKSDSHPCLIERYLVERYAKQVNVPDEMVREAAMECAVFPTDLDGEPPDESG